MVVVENSEQLAVEAANRLVSIAKESIESRGRFDIALSGGNTPRRLYEMLADQPLREQLDWGKTYVFWGDERRVPPSHEDSCYRMARETLLDKVPVPQENIFRMQGEGLQNSAMQDYENKLMRHFKLSSREFPRFDLILLGLGTDGHTASIFPGTRAVSDMTNMVIVYEVPKLRVERITLSRAVINNARNIMFLVSGADKALALANTLEGPSMRSTYPAQGIAPSDGQLIWVVDKAAAENLKSKH
jgi:6-phosphogluconolactonase